MLIEKGWEVPPMMIFSIYGSMSNEQQELIFQWTPDGCRKLIFATNIAETSLTVDGIAFIIDTGFVKQKNFSAETGIEILSVVPISKV